MLNDMSAHVRFQSLAVLLISMATTGLNAAENIAQRPFGQFAIQPGAGEWVITPWYEYTEFFNYFSNGKEVSVETMAEEDSHGFDQNDGLIQFEWGINRGWALDFTVGYTSAATRSFSENGPTVRKTSGMSDLAFGLRYQISRESDPHQPAWVPSVSIRAGGIYGGSYDKDFPFAPGSGSVGIEPSVIALKHFGWSGLGAFSNVGYRYMRSGGHDQWFAETGLQQEFGQWTLNAGYRHFANTGGRSIQGVPPTITYSRQVREVAEQVEGGFSYHDRGGRLYQFYLRKTFAGNNTSDALLFGILASFPLGGESH